MPTTTAPRTFLVTGANRGLGLEFARRLAARGDRVIATARDPIAARDLASLKIRTLRLDVANPDSIAGLSAQLGPEPIDVLINNAGMGGTAKSIADLNAAELQKIFMVNAIAPMLVTQALLKNLRAAPAAPGRSRIVVNITSQLASIANNTGGSTYGYRASKTALNQFNKSLHNELAPEGFVCIALHPGWVRTDMGGPGAHLGVPESITWQLQTIDALTPDHGGRFLNYDGAPMPW